jgi:hypothetical protein
MSFPQSASLLLLLAVICTFAMALWTAARYSVEFEEPHHTMWGATYGMAVLFHLIVLEPLMCFVLELRELFSSYTKVSNYCSVAFLLSSSNSLFQSLRNKVAAISANDEQADKPSAAATVSSNIFGSGGHFFQRKQRAASVKEPPQLTAAIPLTQSIVPAPPARRAALPEAASVSTLSAVYQLDPRVLDPLAAHGSDYVAPSSAAAPPPAFLRRQRSARKEDAWDPLTWNHFKICGLLMLWTREVSMVEKLHFFVFSAKTTRHSSKEYCLLRLKFTETRWCALLAITHRRFPSKFTMMFGFYMPRNLIFKYECSWSGATTN